MSRGILPLSGLFVKFPFRLIVMGVSVVLLLAQWSAFDHLHFAFVAESSSVVRVKPHFELQSR